MMELIEVIEKIPKQMIGEFYKYLAHDLTVGIRIIWGNPDINCEQKLDQIRWVNEIMHRVVKKIGDTKEGDFQWTDQEMQEIIQHWVSQNPHIEPIISHCIQSSYESILRNLP